MDVGDIDDSVIDTAAAAVAEFNSNVLVLSLLKLVFDDDDSSVCLETFKF